MAWVLNRPPKKYQLNGSNCSGGKSCSGSSLSLSEEDDSDSGAYMTVCTIGGAAYSDYLIPEANEIRPENIAVRYFIKAR